MQLTIKDTIMLIAGIIIIIFAGKTIIKAIGEILGWIIDDIIENGPGKIIMAFVIVIFAAGLCFIMLKATNVISDQMMQLTTSFEQPETNDQQPRKEVRTDDR